MKKWTKILLCALLILAVLCPMTNAMALTVDDCAEIYKQAMEILTSGKWIDQGGDDVYIAYEDGRIMYHSGADYSQEYHLTVSFTGALLMSEYFSDGEYRVYDVSFSWDENGTPYMLLTFMQYQGMSRGKLYRMEAD